MKRLGLIGLALVSVAASASAQQSPATGKEEIPAEFKPPKGMCRIWLKDVPAKQQPAPTDCAAAVKNVPQNGRVVFGDVDGKKDKSKDTLPASAKGLTGKGSTPPALLKKKPPVA
jgi:hypothetical protein